MINFEELETLVIKWAADRNILDSTTIEAQYKKLLEEFIELGESLGLVLYYSDYNRKINVSFTSQKYSVIEAKDAIGDMSVVLTLMANLLNSSLHECYDLAYTQIKDRKGKMINGLFVKEG